MPVFDQSTRSAARSRIRAAIRVCPMGSHFLMGDASTSGLQEPPDSTRKARIHGGIGFRSIDEKMTRASAG